MESMPERKVLAWIKRNVKPPLHVQIVPTNKCNIACIFCWRVWEKEESKKQHLVDNISDKRYMEILKEICKSEKLRPQYITITGGGEPLVKKELVLKMVKEIKKHSIKCEIVTNGTLLDEKTVKKLIKYELDNINISINSASEELADFLYGRKNSYKKAIEGMEFLKVWKEALGKDFPTISNTIVVTKYNYKEMPKMVKQCHRLKVDRLNIRWVSEPYCDGKPGPLTMPSEKYREFLHALAKSQQLAKKYGIILSQDFDINDLKLYLNLGKKDDNKVLFSRKNKVKKGTSWGDFLHFFIQQKNAYENLLKIGICTFPFFELFIDANGFASGCGTLANRGGEDAKIAEDVNKKSIEEIWYGKRLNHLRATLLLKKFTHLCRSCNVINIVKMSREWIIRYKNLRNI